MERRTLDEVEQQLKSSTLTQKERAVLEQQLWEGVKVPGTDRGASLRDLLGVGQNALDARFQLLRLGDAADPLWQRVEKDMTLETALHLLRSAKSSGATLEEVISAYDEAAKKPGAVRSIGEGKTVVVGFKFVRPSEPTTKKGARAFNSSVRALVTAYLNSELEDQPEAVRESLADDLFFGLRVLLDDLNAAVAKKRKESKDEKEVLQHPTLRQVKEACNVLGVPVNRTGQFDMAEAKRKYRKMAATFHPDRNTNPDVVKQYHAVNEAWNLLKEYGHG